MNTQQQHKYEPKDDYTGLSTEELRHHVRRETLRYVLDPCRDVTYFRAKQIELSGVNNRLTGRILTMLSEEGIVEMRDPNLSNTKSYKFTLDPFEELAYWIAADMEWWGFFYRSTKTLHVLDCRTDVPATLCREEEHGTDRGDAQLHQKPASSIPHGHYPVCGSCQKALEVVWEEYL